MALKMDRQVDAVSLEYFLNEVAERGVIVSVSTTGSGVSMDSTLNIATVAAASSGSRPLGLLLNDFVSIDRSRLPVNWHKDQQAVGDKSTIMRKGWVVTNKVSPGHSPSGGMLAGLRESGTIGAFALGTLDSVQQPIVGRWLSKKDQEGYAKVEIDL